MTRSDIVQETGSNSILSNEKEKGIENTVVAIKRRVRRVMCTTRLADGGQLEVKGRE